MTRALFEVGEEVIVRMFNRTSVGTVLVVELDNNRAFEGREGNVRKYTGYSYRVTCSNFWNIEEFLRKLPKPADCSFKEMISKLNKEPEKTEVERFFKIIADAISLD